MNSITPIIYISRSRVKPGRLEMLTRAISASMETLAVTKLSTLFQYCYLDEDQHELTIVHLFGDAWALKQHLKGAGERLAEFSPLVELYAAELYGQPGPEIQELMRLLLEAGASVHFSKEAVGGFMRLQTLARAA